VQTGTIANAGQCDLSGPHFQHQLDRLDKNVPVYVYCAVGGRSAQAAQILAQSGFKQVYNLTGGVQGWVQAGNSLQPFQR
jgi:rhodanese-related sulfurtransferase